MKHPDIYSATLGLSHPWLITTIKLDRDGLRLDISVDFVPDGLFACPQCGTRLPSLAAEMETWHHSDFFEHETYLHARVPRLECSTCGPLPVDRPWTRAGSRFVRN